MCGVGSLVARRRPISASRSLRSWERYLRPQQLSVTTLISVGSSSSMAAGSRTGQTDGGDQGRRHMGRQHMLAGASADSSRSKRREAGISAGARRTEGRGGHRGNWDDGGVCPCLHTRDTHY